MRTSPPATLQKQKKAGVPKEEVIEKRSGRAEWTNAPPSTSIEPSRYANEAMRVPVQAVAKKCKDPRRPCMLFYGNGKAQRHA